MNGAVTKTADIVTAARQRGDDIVWIVIDSDDVDLWGNEYLSIHPELNTVRDPNDPVFQKQASDAFSNKEFEQWLSTQVFNQLIFTGFHITDCVQATLSGAIKRGYPFFYAMLLTLNSQDYAQHQPFCKWLLKSMIFPLT